MQETPSHYFRGFHRSEMFEYLFHRLAYLEKWNELAIRPKVCDPEDEDLWNLKVDDIPQLQARCLEVRQRMNEVLPPIETTEWEKSLKAKTSAIPNSGLGLYYEPSNEQPKSIPKGTIICYYTGYLHSFQSAQKLLFDKKDYLMAVQGSVLVDPGPVPTITARYINDPLNEDLINCKFVPNGYRSAVVTTKDVHIGEEFYVAYGDSYWSGQKIIPSAYRPTNL